ncbi:TPA: DNA methylase, partial [Enterococcus faecalis]|nr:DNA methylase [Enterococcus faecalis]
ASINNLNKLYRWRINGKGGTTSGTYYIPSTYQENNPFLQFNRKINDYLNLFETENKNVYSSVSSATNSLIESNSIDYIFTDPPFGSNLMYSELSLIWETWLGVKTDNDKEAIVSKVQNKNLSTYESLMETSFKEYYRVLKPNHWITIEFSNSKANVWNALQNSIQKAGFIIANVSALDKQQGSFKAVTTTTAVKQDLVISAYKPLEENITKIKKANGDEISAWLFLDQHLVKLPVFDGGQREAVVITERTPRILFDRMVAYHVQSGMPVPISSAEFQEKVAQKYVMRDGMVFLESQVAEYDKKRILAKEFSQQSLFVSDESSAIEWLRQQLMKKPQSRQDLHPQFMKEIQHIAKHEELPELDNLLVENFLLYDSEDVVPDQIAAYLRKNYHDMRGLENQDDKLKSKAKNRWYVPDPNKQADLEKLREKSLLREFNHYVEEVSGTKKKLKLFRSEAIRAGFKQAWSEKDYQKIVDVAEYLPEKIIQEDDKLLMFHTHALMRLDI